MADQQKLNFLELQNKSFDIKFNLNDTNYKSVENIGTGAYGVVCSALHVSTGDMVAIKKIPDIFDQPTVAKRTYREIKILKHFKHDNIIAIREILKPQGMVANLRDVYIVLDLMETDLHRIIHSKQELSDEHVRYFMYQILRGLKYIHSANVIHRDLKPSNLLVNENCDLKIGDFGMARAVSTRDDGYNALMTQYVATRWYRAPELMMARLAYTGAVDMWSVGCIFAEMLGRKQIFPGRDFIHQLKLIIGILGTPTKEFLKLTQSDTIKKFIKGWGDKKPVPLTEMYPKAPSQAIHLLVKMLIINPQHRINIQPALSHPFLSKYHDPSDEPICIPAFDFDFEEKAKTTSDVKQSIIKEIMEYHVVKEKPQLVFDFRPVPKNEINQSKLSPNNTPSSSVAKADGSIDSGGSNFGLDTFLKEIQNKKEGSNDSNTGFAAFLAQSSMKGQNTSNQMPSFLSTNSPTDDEQSVVKNNVEGFKVPNGLPLAKMRNLRVKSDEKRDEEDDIEMLSAKSGTSDVVMLSAKKGDDLSSSNDSNVVVTTKSSDKVLNTKEVLKAAILSAALRKQKGALLKKQQEESSGKPKPMTALQRQREREDKKRKKIEKAQERKKKQKNKKKGSSSINLSTEDLGLLERWAGMQNVPQPTLVVSNKLPKLLPKPAPSEALAGQHQAIKFTSTGNQLQTTYIQQNANMTNTLPSTVTNMNNYGNSVIISSMQNSSVIKNSDHEIQFNRVPANQDGCLRNNNQISDQGYNNPNNLYHNSQTSIACSNQIGNNVTNLQGQYINHFPANHSQQNTTQVYHTTTVAASNNSTMYSAANSPPESVHNQEFFSQQNLPLNDTTVHYAINPHQPMPATHENNEVYTTQSNQQLPVPVHQSSDTLSPLSNPLESLLDVLAQDSLTSTTSQQSLPEHLSSRLPPTYTEAIQTNIHNIGSPEQTSGLHFLNSPEENNVTQHDNAQTSSGEKYLPFHSYQQSDATPAVASYEGSLSYNPQINTGDPSNSDSQKESGNMLSVITHKMMKSHVDDLTLTKTPKGTGGGYGVGLDMEMVMAEASRQFTPRPGSAPLSATESLIGDWLEVSGMKGLDAKDYEALERELGLGSPINLSDIVTTPS